MATTAKNRVIVAGSRKFRDYDFVKAKLERLLSHLPDIEIVCGEATGPDLLGRKWAEESGRPIASFPADWKAYKKAAGYRRNEEMAEYATHCIVFWDGESKGSKHMIDIAKRKGLPLRVINVGKSPS